MHNENCPSEKQYSVVNWNCSDRLGFKQRCAAGKWKKKNDKIHSLSGREKKKRDDALACGSQLCSKIDWWHDVNLPEPLSLGPPESSTNMNAKGSRIQDPMWTTRGVTSDMGLDHGDDDEKTMKKALKLRSDRRKILSLLAGWGMWCATRGRPCGACYGLFVGVAFEYNNKHN